MILLLYWEILAAIFVVLRLSKTMAAACLCKRLIYISFWWATLRYEMKLKAKNSFIPAVQLLPARGTLAAWTWERFISLPLKLLCVTMLVLESLHRLLGREKSEKHSLHCVLLTYALCSNSCSSLQFATWGHASLFLGWCLVLRVALDYLRPVLPHVTHCKPYMTGPVTICVIY